MKKDNKNIIAFNEKDEIKLVEVAKGRLMDLMKSGDDVEGLIQLLFEMRNLTVFFPAFSGAGLIADKNKHLDLQSLKKVLKQKSFLVAMAEEGPTFMVYLSKEDLIKSAPEGFDFVALSVNFMELLKQISLVCRELAGVSLDPDGANLFLNMLSVNQIISIFKELGII